MLVYCSGKLQNQTTQQFHDIKLASGEERVYREPRHSIEKKVGLIHKGALNVGNPVSSGCQDMLAPHFGRHSSFTERRLSGSIQD